MKLGRAVEISPSVFREQFTSCDKISQAASADSLLLSTLKQNEFCVQKALQIHSVTFLFHFTFWKVMSKKTLIVNPSLFFITPKSMNEKYKTICYKLTTLLNTLVKYSMLRGQLNSLFQDPHSTSFHVEGPEPIPIPLYIPSYQNARLL